MQGSTQSAYFVLKERLSNMGKPVKKSGPRKGEVLQYVQQAAVKRKLLLGTQNDEIESQSAQEREPAAHGARSARSSNCSGSAGGGIGFISELRFFFGSGEI